METVNPTGVPAPPALARSELRPFIQLFIVYSYGSNNLLQSIIMALHPCTLPGPDKGSLSEALELLVIVYEADL